MLTEITSPVADWIFPRRCYVCSMDIIEGRMCDSCLSLCTTCPHVSYAETLTVPALFYYELTIKQMMKAAKYQRKPHLVRLLRELIESQLKASSLLGEIYAFSPSAVAYVPSHWLNRLLRGVELQYLFAQILSAKLKIPIIIAFTRKHFFHRQALYKRKAERLSLITGSYELKKNLARQDRIVLVDDIVTTGATIHHVGKLAAKISKKVFPVAIAKTP